MGADTAAVVRFEPDGMATLMGGHHARRRAGARFAPDEGYVVASVRRTGHAARFDTQDPTAIEMPDAVRQEGICSGAASPIVVDGRLWGTITVASLHRSLPAATERRLGDFTELVATAIANADARAEIGQLAQQHAALRRVATLVAEDAPASELFDAVAREVGTLLGGDFAGLARFEDGFAVGLGAWAAAGEHPPFPPRWRTEEGDPATAIEHAPAPTRWNDWTNVPGPIAAFFREIGVRSSVGTPIVVEGRLWGALALHSKRSDPFPPETEARMQEFTDLVGTAIANAQARGDLSELAQEQAALRRVATLVAQGTSPEQVFGAVAEEVAELLACPSSAVIRFEEEGMATVLASLGGPHADGQRVELDPAFVGGAVRETGCAARFDPDDPAGPDVPELARAHSVRSAVASPVVVEGELWGAIAVGSLDRRLPAAVERRLTAFTELVAPAVANTQARAQVRALADEQAALRRVATLVAREAPADEVLTAIADESRRLFGTQEVGMVRYEEDHLVVLAAGAADAFPVGSEVPLDDGYVVSRVYRTGAAVRI